MLMQRAELISLYSRKRRTTQQQAGKEGVLHENLLNRQFACEVLGTIFVTDISFALCCDGWLYLAIYLDLATRMPKAYGITDHLRKSFAVDPFEQLTRQGVTKKGSLIHSDQGSQYRSCAFAALCEANGLKQSMSAPGKPIDNAVAEAFFKTLETEQGSCAKTRSVRSGNPRLHGLSSRTLAEDPQQ